ncbi:MAG: SUMF1/EgtB/PvdO family nonheme iron enzyme [Caldilineae bacterium]|nr:SUMF1/EgtB/PvdO family nonheme iron enzyme [Caldilineae bacterium]
MKDLPEGRLTILFSDIEGSTELVKRLGPRFPEVLDQHNRLIRGAFRARGGVEVRTIGDAFFYVFHAPLDALLAAVEAQRALQGHAFPHGEPIRVRMGLHTGEIARFDQDYAGFEVHRAARIAGAAHGGQVLVSQVTADALAGLLPPGLSLLDRGAHWLKDIDAPEPLLQAQAEGMRQVDRAPVSLGRPPLRMELRSAPDPATAPRESDQLRDDLRQALLGEGAPLQLSEAELARLVQLAPADIETLWLSRIAEWSQPRYRIDTRFVRLTLLLDQGAQVGGERWLAAPERFESLPELIEALAPPALVLLGPPGSGKSTLLRHLELSLCSEAIRAAAAGSGQDDPPGPVPCFVALASYRATLPGAPPPPPLAWLAERWRQRYPGLPTLDSLAEAGRLVLLLDGLNEMPHADEGEYRRKVEAWREALRELLQLRPGNRVVFSCRSLDYSAPLSTPELPVPQLRVEPFDDARVQQYLALHLPDRAPAIWRELAGRPSLDMLRRPYFLSLLVAQVAETGQLPPGPASLFTGFVRQALRREIEQGNALFADGELLAERDGRRLLQARQWRTPWELPSRGALIPGLERLAFGMQDSQSASAGHQVRVGYDDALDLLAHPRDADILRAGAALALLDEDLERDELRFFHQLLQEYFAARRLARAPEPERVAKPWRASELEPALALLLDRLAPADPLPVLPATGWEETSRLAAVMAEDPVAYLSGLMAADLPLAGRCAAEPELAGRLPEALVDTLRAALVARAEDPAADLRARIPAARALGRLGDPRLASVADGAALLPPFVEIPSGPVRMGSADDDALARPDERPAGRVTVAAFAIGRFPVTNAEWARFMAAGGYAEPRWWPTGPAADWRRGEGVTEGQKHNWRHWRSRFAADPAALETLAEKGTLTPEQAEDWRRYAAMDDSAFERVLEAQFPDARWVAPRKWSDPSFANPAQPVVGICWYEARAYCAWLGALTGQRFRLPSEAEWAAAARGAEGRRFAWGEAFDPLRGNLAATRLKAPAPVGIFPEGRSPEGVDDLSGSCFEWTGSLYGREDGRPDFTYPYRGDDGREDADAPAELLRVARGGSWADGEATARAAYRYPVHPALRHTTVGFRLVRDLGDSSR